MITTKKEEIREVIATFYRQGMEQINMAHILAAQNDLRIFPGATVRIVTPTEYEALTWNSSTEMYTDDWYPSSDEDESAE